MQRVCHSGAGQVAREGLVCLNRCLAYHSVFAPFLQPCRMHHSLRDGECGKRSLRGAELMHARNRRGLRGGRLSRQMRSAAQHQHRHVLYLLLSTPPHSSTPSCRRHCRWRDDAHFICRRLPFSVLAFLPTASAVHLIAITTSTPSLLRQDRESTRHWSAWGCSVFEWGGSDAHGALRARRRGGRAGGPVMGQCVLLDSLGFADAGWAN